MTPNANFRQAHSAAIDPQSPEAWSPFETPVSRRAWLGASLLMLGGCSAPILRLQSPDEAATSGETEKIPRLVGDMAVPFGTGAVEVSAVALVTGLEGTGGDPGPSAERELLVNDMLRRGISRPSEILKDSSVSLVVARGFLRAGVQKGDRFDLQLRVPNRSVTSSLRNGWLMEARLKEMAVINNDIREGHPLALASGPVLVDEHATGSDKLSGGRGVVLGGGVCLKARPLGLILKSRHKSITKSARIGEVINHRFFLYEGGVQKGVATPKTDEYIEIALHPRYKDNVGRYLRVLRALALRETTSERQDRLVHLERQLLDPSTARAAALRLEAIGREAISALERGLRSEDVSVRFHAAEALGYLNEPSAARPLAQVARDQPEFRPFAFTALSAMDDSEAYDALRKLLDVASAETRYGAFRALWAMNPDDPLVRGESLNGHLSYHVLDTQGPPMIHVTRAQRAEVVVFGHQQRFSTPLLLDAGPHIMVTCRQAGGEEVRVTRFKAGEDEQRKTVTPRVDDVLRAIVELGGSYADVIRALQQAKETKVLPGRFEIDAIPHTEVIYAAAQDGEAEPGKRAPAGDGDDAQGGLPELFSKPPRPDNDEETERSHPGDEAQPEPPGFFQRFLGTMRGDS